MLGASFSIFSRRNLKSLLRIERGIIKNGRTLLLTPLDLMGHCPVLFVTWDCERHSKGMTKSLNKMLVEKLGIVCWENSVLEFQKNEKINEKSLSKILNL